LYLEVEVEHRKAIFLSEHLHRHAIAAVATRRLQLPTEIRQERVPIHPGIVAFRQNRLARVREVCRRGSVMAALVGDLHDAAAVDGDRAGAEDVGASEEGGV